MNLPLKKILLAELISPFLKLGGYSAIGTGVKKRNLEVKTQMSETIMCILRVWGEKNYT